MIRLLSRWFVFQPVSLPEQMKGLVQNGVVDGPKQIVPPTRTQDGWRHEAKRHAEPTVCHKCDMLTGFNDGIQPCGACFADDLERVQNVIDQANATTKLRRIK